MISSFGYKRSGRFCSLVLALVELTPAFRALSLLT